MSPGRKSVKVTAGADLFGEAPKPAAADVDPSRVPRFRRLGRADIFDHPCSVCGAPDAPFGKGVFLNQKRLGAWLCGACRKAK